jgi:hypothetical protein
MMDITLGVLGDLVKLDSDQSDIKKLKMDDTSQQAIPACKTGHHV